MLQCSVFHKWMCDKAVLLEASSSRLQPGS